MCQVGGNLVLIRPATGMDLLSGPSFIEKRLIVSSISVAKLILCATQTSSSMKHILYILLHDFRHHGIPATYHHIISGVGNCWV